MLCAPKGCGCSFQSSSIVISGSGAAGDPLTLETMGPGVVATSADVASPFQGQTIYETTTDRFKVYDGTNWVIFGGQLPGINAQRITTLSIPDAGASFTDVTLLNEVYDTDSFHAASAAAFTVPVGLGGKYHLGFGLTYASASLGYRAVQVVIASNTAATNELSSLIVGGHQATNTNNNGWSGSKDVLLEAGAVCTLKTYQTSGGALNVTQAFMTLQMLEHRPDLT